MDDTHIPLQQREASLVIPINTENLREELNFYGILRDTFKDYGKNTDDLEFIIRYIEEQLFKLSNKAPALPDEMRMTELIQKHPYFRNPCKYPIRLLTILKYLKKNGMNLHYRDIDLYVDRLVAKMDGVKRVGKGLYLCTGS